MLENHVHAVEIYSASCQTLTSQNFSSRYETIISHNLMLPALQMLIGLKDEHSGLLMISTSESSSCISWFPLSLYLFTWTYKAMYSCLSGVKIYEHAVEGSLFVWPAEFINFCSFHHLPQWGQFASAEMKELSAGEPFITRCGPG